MNETITIPVRNKKNLFCLELGLVIKGFSLRKKPYTLKKCVAMILIVEYNFLYEKNLWTKLN